MSVRLRSSLAGIPSYKAGQAPTARPDIETHKLSSNENHYAPLPDIVADVAAELPNMNRYPDFASARLASALAQRFDVPTSDVVVGPGSVGVLQQIFHIVCEPGTNAVFGWRSFESYPIMTQIAGAEARRIPLDADHRHDLDAMSKAIDADTRLVIVCNPNNPTSTAVGHDALAAFIDSVPDDVLVLIDEAYREFVDPASVPDGLDFYRQRDNVIVLRTFSKAYGLASLRVGFSIAHEAVSDALRQVQLPFGVSSLAQVAGVSALQHEDALIERVQAIVRERDRLTQAVTATGMALAESEANFVWLPLGARTDEFAAICDDAGLSVRPFPGEGVRVTVGDERANDRFIEISRAWVSA
jgi:histidinol-phosphate aminotransferase